VAIIGSGDIGTDLMMKILRSNGPLTMGAMVDTDPRSDALARAAGKGVPTSVRGVDGLRDMPNFADIRLVFNTTDVAHQGNWARLAETGVRMVDLTPSGSGPYCVPAVNLDEHLDAPNLSLVTSGAQAAAPIVAAVGQSGIVCYAETVSAISARAAGPGARAHIDCFTESTANALQVVGGAERGKAIMILNPADPPILMRNNVFCLVDGLEGAPGPEWQIETDVLAMVDKVNNYVRGYRLKHRVQFDTFGMDNALNIPETGNFIGTKVTVLLEVAGVGDHLPEYAGNIDTMTSVAKLSAERLAARAGETIGAAK
jgi:acetaldehyde dehydrogenase